MNLEPSDFRLIRDHLRRASGISLDDGKEYLVNVRLRPVVERHGLRSFGELASALGRGGQAVVDDVVDAMTTNETSFFRDAPLWTSLTTSVIPSLIDARRSERTLRFWSAASSSGQEALTLAIVLADRFAEIASWDVSIHATDISETMIDRVRAGVYSEQEIGRGLPLELRERYFDVRGSAYQAKHSLLERIESRQMNLAEPFHFIPPMDLILIRNVMIYFDHDTKSAIIDRMKSVLRPDGYLALGSSESVGRDRSMHLARVEGASFYRPTAAA